MLHVALMSVFIFFLVSLLLILTRFGTLGEFSYSRPKFRKSHSKKFNNSLEESYFTLQQFIGNKAKGRISKRLFQENKASQIFRKKEHF